MFFVHFRLYPIPLPPEVSFWCFQEPTASHFHHWVCILFTIGDQWVWLSNSYKTLHINITKLFYFWAYPYLRKNPFLLSVPPCPQYKARLSNLPHKAGTKPYLKYFQWISTFPLTRRSVICTVLQTWFYECLAILKHLSPKCWIFMFSRDAA